MAPAPKSTLNRWIVVAAAFSAQFILEGIILALDVLPPYILRYFHSTNAEVTLFGAVVHGFSHILGKNTHHTGGGGKTGGGEIVQKDEKIGGNRYF